ncbi:MAG: sigma 54-dependent Fis family transcriptional regulator [Nitrospirae bacterium]|nr:sigma 54-dependent Fis family transcriptional regulator [Nitrospirota bacterium]
MTEIAPEVTKLVSADERPTKLVFRKLLFRLLRGPEKGRKVVVDKDVVRLGTASDNNVVLTDETISRHHAEIRLTPRGYLLLDLGSTNGTSVGGFLVREAYVPPYSTIALGATQITFEPLKDQVEVALSERTSFGDLAGTSVAMRRVFALLERVAPTDITVLIEGETGTGKELVARALHQHSPRKDGPFVVFDSGSVPKTLAESELFGHMRGSFTGAQGDKMGALELAHRGTLFLDEIGELDPELQPKLLRALEQREIRRIGGTSTIKVDVRFLAATNRNLEEEVRTGRFRNDLFYRLNTIRVHMPPLRERREDLPLLIEKILKDLGPSEKSRLPAETIPLFQSYSWPGNVRELRNSLQKLLVLPDHRDFFPKETERRSAGVDISVPFKDAKRRLLTDFERQYLSQLLSAKGYNISESARTAGIDRKYLERMVKKLQLK